MADIASELGMSPGNIYRFFPSGDAIIRERIEAGEFKVEDPAEAARAVKFAFMPFFHPILIEQRVQHDEDTETDLCEQIRFVLKVLGKSD